MNLQEIVSTALPKKEEGKPYLAILKEPLSLDEKRVAIFTLACKKLDTYVPFPKPTIPHGFTETYEEYKMCKDKQERSNLWRGMLDEYPEYFKELNRVEMENLSNIHFLKEMIEHFDKMGMSSQSEKVQLQLHKYNV